MTVTNLKRRLKPLVADPSDSDEDIEVNVRAAEKKKRKVSVNSENMTSRNSETPFFLDSITFLIMIDPTQKLGIPGVMHGSVTLEESKQAFSITGRYISQADVDRGVLIPFNFFIATSDEPKKNLHYSTEVAWQLLVTQITAREAQIDKAIKTKGRQPQSLKSMLPLVVTRLEDMCAKVSNSLQTYLYINLL